MKRSRRHHLADLRNQPPRVIGHLSGYSNQVQLAFGFFFCLTRSTAAAAAAADHDHLTLQDTN
jgi:hypothetical protein